MKDYHLNPIRSSAPRSEGPIRPAADMPVIHPHAAGIDVGSTQHYVCVPADSVPAGQLPVRSFGGFTHDLDQLVDWLKQCGVQTAAMESTGIYWVGLYEKLEAAGIKPVLVNARHLRQVPGRKTDVKDAQWLQQLHSYGLLNGSFRPAEEICRLRTLVRHRGNLVAQKAQQIQHMQRALQLMNILVHHVVSDLDGETGLRIVDAIIAGQRDPQELVKLRDYRIKRSTVGQMKAALHGHWRSEQLLVLTQSREAYRFFEQQIGQCDCQIQVELQKIPSAALAPAPLPAVPAAQTGENASAVASSKKRKRRSGGNDPAMDLMPELIRICGVDLSSAVGLNMLGILILISELGLDMSRWRNQKAFCAWLGLAPGNKISGGRLLSTHTPHVVSRVACLLRTMAVVVGRTDTCLGSFHRRMRSRLGPAAAATATARKLACVIYHMLKTKQPFRQIDRALYEEKIRHYRIKKLRQQAKELGMELVELQKAA